jgi:hypothetical protein
MHDLRPRRVQPNDLRLPANWRKRDADVFADLRDLSVCSAHLAHRFGGRSLAAKRKKAAAWLCRQRRRGRVRVVGVIQRRDTGRPEVMYGRRVAQVELDHEAHVSDVRFHFRSWPFSRDARVGKTTSDGVLTIDGRRCYLEIDMGTMTRKQMQKKWNRYGVVGDIFILVVSPTEARMDRMRGWAEKVKDVAFFTTFDRLFAGRPWVSFSGETMTI